MARMLDHLREAIVDGYIPTDQTFMRESIVVGHTQQEMHCEVFPHRNQEHLLCQFDRSGFNNQSFPYFDPSVDGLLSMCDYILFVEEAQRLLVLLVELKHCGSPKRQLDINQTFGKFICERLHVIFEDFDKPIIYRKIGVKEKYNYLHETQDYVCSFDTNDMLMLPNPHKLLLGLISKIID